MNSSHVYRFKDRRDAGLQLAEPITPLLKTQADALILALPRGGVPVAAQVAKKLGCPFDVLIVRKIGVPGQRELAMGAIASGGVRVLSHDLIEQIGLSPAQVEAVIREETGELQRRETLYRNGRASPLIEGRTIIVIDDGMATGATMSAAIQLLRQQKAAHIIVAVPVAPKDTLRRVRHEADTVVCLLEPDPFYAVGNWYDDFGQTTDEEVRAMLSAEYAHAG